jgi:hypothetical protein
VRARFRNHETLKKDPAARPYRSKELFAGTKWISLVVDYAHTQYEIEELRKGVDL